MKRRAVNDSSSLTVSTSGQIYGCTGLFDLCSDQDLMSLSFQGSEPLLDWIGWEATDVCRIKKNFITYIRPEYSGESPTAGYVADPCGDSNGAEWGTCDFTLEDFGRLRRHTPVRDITKTGLRLCDLQPRYRLDGTPITDELEYELRIATEALLQDLRRYVVTGSSATPGLFAGLQELVNNDYEDSLGHRCQMMDSIVVDWNANSFAGGAGITWNGAAVGSTFNFIDVLLAVYRRIRKRINWSPELRTQPMQPGDMVLVGTESFIAEVLNAYTCWSVCPGVQYQEANLNTFDARSFRDKLNGGMFGYGQITLDGFTIPLLQYDWGLQKGPTLSDGYLLTGHIGSARTISGQYNDMRIAAQKRPGWFDYTDGGRVLTWLDSDETCENRQVEMQPRLLMWAPWANARFVDVRATLPGGVLSADPTETSFFPETSFRSV